MKTPHQIHVPGRVVRIAMMLLAPLALYPQGALTPPGGPAPMMKTLQQVEPRIDLATVSGSATERHRITEPGSYYLTENITSSPGSSVINIQSSDVTLDLNGYTISASCSYAITIGEVSNIVIRNGIIHSTFYRAIVSSDTNTGDIAVEHVQLRNVGTAIRAPAARLVVRDCVLDGQGTTSIHGIYAGQGSLVQDTVISGFASSGSYACAVRSDGAVRIANCALSNNFYGVYVGNGSMLSGCIIKGNGSNGVNALQAGISLSNCDIIENGLHGVYIWDDTAPASQTLIVDCRIADNTNCGIYAYWNLNLQVERCTVSNNGSDGIHIGLRSIVADCVVASNNGNYGISVGNNSTVRDCIVEATTGSGALSCGISTGDRCRVTGCTVSETTNTNSPSTNMQGAGIRTGNTCVVENCTARNNSGDGIYVPYDSRVVGNTCSGNGFTGDPNRDGAGIHAGSYNCVIEGNVVFFNDRGIDVDGSPSVITGNYARSNTTNYDIVAGNRVGTIVSCPSSGAISGTTGGSGLGSTDPWANFSY